MTDSPPTLDAPIASECSLCGEGYHDDLDVDVADDPTDGEYRWCHTRCLQDDARQLRDAFHDGQLDL